MVAPVIGPDGQLQSILRTYIGDVPTRKKFAVPVETVCGAAVRLFEPTTTLGVTEDIETAIAVHELFALPVWAAISTAGLQSFEPPAGVTDLVIYGDNDSHKVFAGQLAAYALANRIAVARRPDLSIDVQITPNPGDWLDVLNARRRAA